MRSEHSVNERPGIWWFHVVERRVDRGFMILGGVLVFSLMLLIACDVAGRYFFNKPITGTLEISQNVMVLLVFSSIPYYQLTHGHMTITMLTERVPPKVRFWLSVVANFITAGTCALLAWQTFANTAHSFKLKETATGLLQIPLWPPKSAIFVCFSLLGIHFLVKLAELVAGGLSSRRRT